MIDRKKWDIFQYLVYKYYAFGERKYYENQENGTRKIVRLQISNICKQRTEIFPLFLSVCQNGSPVT